MENLDLREILKNVPKGTILYSTICGYVEFDKIDNDNSKYPIICCNKYGLQLFTKEGKYNYYYDNDCECVLFPSKEQRDWNTFCPFKDGDILYVKTLNTEFIFIYKDNDLYNINDHVAYSKSGTFYLKPSYSCGLCDKRNILNIRLATEEEKEKLFDVIKENGYKWTAETKTLEKLIAPNGYTIGNATRNSNKLIVEYIKNKPQYPKTYNECCNVLIINPKSNDAQGYKADDIICFQELLIARDAYLKIAGKEMGLSEPWKPNWNDDSPKWCIIIENNELTICKNTKVQRFLSFQSEELAKEFLANFKSIIESAKELI